MSLCLDGYSPKRGLHTARPHVVSIYTRSLPHWDLSRGLAPKHGFRIFPAMRETLTLGGRLHRVSGPAQPL